MKVMLRPRRLVTAALTVVLTLALAACSGQELPNTTFDPHTEFGRDIDALWGTMLFWGTLVFVLVEAALIFVVVRYRRREGTGEPKHVHGNTTLEILWTVLPAVILVLIAVPTVRTIFTSQAAAPASAVRVNVIGHQWWWEFEYPQYGFKTANELYLPTGRTVAFELRTQDVLHSFWIPQLGGKRDLITNRTNYLWFTPDSTMGSDVWNGFCTEYCGASHANMKFRAFTVSQADFERWAEHQRSGPAVLAPPTGAPTPGAPTAPGAPAPGAAGAAQQTVSGTNSPAGQGPGRAGGPPATPAAGQPGAQGAAQTAAGRGGAAGQTAAQAAAGRGATPGQTTAQGAPGQTPPPGAAGRGAGQAPTAPGAPGAPAAPGGAAATPAGPGAIVPGPIPVLTSAGMGQPLFPTLPEYAIPKTPYPASLTFNGGAGGNAERGRQLFARTACVGCHVIQGVSQSPIGPNLTHMGSRTTIGAGLYPNDAEHLARWIKNAPAMKPGVIMPPFGKGIRDPRTNAPGILDDAQIADLVAYLLALK